MSKRILILGFFFTGFFVNSIVLADSSPGRHENQKSQPATSTGKSLSSLSDLFDEWSAVDEKDVAKSPAKAPVLTASTASSSPISPDESEVKTASVLDLEKLLSESPVTQTAAINEDWLYAERDPVSGSSYEGTIPEKPSLSTAFSPLRDHARLEPPNFSLDNARIMEGSEWPLRVEQASHLISPYFDRGDFPEVVPRSNTDFGYTSLWFELPIPDLFYSQIRTNAFFKWDFLDGPTTGRVDGQAYVFGIGFNKEWRIGPRFQVEGNLTPLYSSDFHNHSSDSFRLVAGGALTYHANDWLQFVAGASFLDRKDLPVLPIGGVRILVDRTLELDLVIPKPRVSFLAFSGSDYEHWLYCGGEVGGESWAIRRESSHHDQMGYKDFRLVFGSEIRKSEKPTLSYFEAGYVFNRKLSMLRWGGTQDLQETFFIRIGSQY